MLSLYIHIPFCDKKCGYCSFFVHPEKTASGANTTSDFPELINAYVESVCKEIIARSEKMNDKSVYTIYFGGGTPGKIGAGNIDKIIDTITTHFDTTQVAELSIELNPDPFEETLTLVKHMIKRYSKRPRVRFSFGIQTFDNHILQESGRNYTSQALPDFFRSLLPIKQPHVLYNFDFIAFGKLKVENGESRLRDQSKMEFFERLVNSQIADSFSLYTLELFEGSERYHQIKNQKSKIKDSDTKTIELHDGFGLRKYGSDDDVYEEFSILKEIILDAGYRRYELSNYALAGKSSIHNRVYRTMGNYLGIGASAASFAPWGPTGQLHRRTNTTNLRGYIKGHRMDEKSITPMREEDYLIEKFFLGLRTDRGVQDIEKFEKVLVADYKKKMDNFVEQGFMKTNTSTFEHLNNRALTDKGMDVYNTVVSELLR